MRRPLVVSVLAIAMGCNAPVFAQEALIGTYSGTLEGKTANSQKIGVTLVIASVDGMVVKGTVTRHQKGACNGDYPMEGSIDGNTLVMKATQKSDLDCNFKMNVKVEGSKLVGTGIGDRPIVLSK